ncbi:MAG: hypothetical protein CMM93_08650, partial [Rickettsiales bacterium]|nr:hypothetical protein [Rickettsiales bacterium]
FTSATNTLTRAAEKERLELFRLQSQIFSTNTSTKDRVKLINELKASYPELLKDIDAETVGNEKLRVSLKKVNDELINRIIIAREQDKINSQAETTADELEDKLRREEELRETVAKIAQRYSDFRFDADKTELQNAKALFALVQERTKGERSYFEQGFRDRKNLSLAIRNVRFSETKYQNEVAKGNELLEKRNEMMKRLGITNTDSTGGGDGGSGDGDGPSEGDTKFIGGDLYKFQNGRWVKVVEPEGDPPGKDNSQFDKTNEILQQTIDLKNSLIKDGFLKELQILETHHARVIAELESQLLDETKLKGRAQEDAIVRNAAIREQIVLQEEIYQNKIGALVEKTIQEDIQAQQDKFEKEAQLRQTAFNNEMAAFKGTQEERERLEEEFERDELSRKAKHIQKVVDTMQRAIDSGDWEGIDLDILTDDELQAIKDRLLQLGLSLSEIEAILNRIRGGGGEQDGFTEFKEEVDILGFSAAQWEQTYDNLETFKGKIKAAEMAVAAFQNAWAMYHQFVSNKERQRLQEFEKRNNAQQAGLKRRLDAGIINQRQYDEAQKALELQMEKRRIEVERKQAKRQKQMTIFGIITNTALAVVKMLSSFPPPANFVMAGLVGALGAAQLAIAASQPLPSASGYEFGYGYGDTYPMRREQDGKVFNVGYGGEPESGVVKRPTHFIAAENGPEFIITNRDWRRFNPEVMQSVRGELARLRGYESGYQAPRTEAPISLTSEDVAYLATTVTKLNGTLKGMEKGIPAYLSNDLRNIEEIDKKIKELNELKKKAVL